MINDIQTSKVIFNQNGVTGWQILQKEGAEFVLLEFEKGAKTEAHIQDIPMVFFVVKGIAKAILEKKEYQIKQGQLIEIASGMQRQWINTGNEKLELFVTKLIG